MKTFTHSYVMQPELGSVVILDPAGEFVEQIAHWREFIGAGSERLIYISLKLKLGMVPTINPFEISGIDPSEMSEYALLIKHVVAQQIIEAFEQIIAGSVGSAITTPMEGVAGPMCPHSRQPARIVAVLISSVSWSTATTLTMPISSSMGLP